MAKFFCFIAIAILTATHNIYSSTNDTVEVFTIKPDDQAVIALDSLAALLYFENLPDYSDLKATKDFFPVDFVPEYSDSVYQKRMEKLNRRSPIEFTYNARVKPFINLYAKNRRDLTERVLGLAELHFPYFEEQLDKYDLPLELKYVAVIESALNPVARSRAGATGIWQFMLGTGRMYGLMVNSYVDDRADVVKATEAACRHFRDLYNIYGDWHLVLAAYNAGAGNVNRAIRRAGGAKNFWAISSFLPRETRNYVPAFIAVTYVMEYAEEHNLFSVPPPYTYNDIDIIQVREQLSFSAISELIDVPYDHIRYLNPSFRKGVIPKNPSAPYVLRLPKKYTGLFIANEDKIYNFKTEEEIRQEQLAARMAETQIHVVRSGEVLGTIARRYGTTVREIQQLNNLRGTMIRTGQRLVVRAPQPLALPNISQEHNVHVVQRGESLSIIANRYRVSVNDLRAWNNLSGNTIFPNQRLIVRPGDSHEDIADAEELQEQDTADIKDEKFDLDISFEVEVDEWHENLFFKDESYFIYIVKKGDTLTDIANKYDNVNVNDIMIINNLDNTETLEKGQAIKIIVQ